MSSSSKKKATPQPPDAADLDAVQTALAQLRLDVTAQIDSALSEMAERYRRTQVSVASIVDRVTRAEQTLNELRDSVGTLDQRIISASNNLAGLAKAANESAERAADAAQLFELKEEAKADVRERIHELASAVASERDEVARVRETIHTMSKRLDEFDLVAVDYDQTKNQVASTSELAHRLNTRLTLSDHQASIEASTKNP